MMKRKKYIMPLISVIGNDEDCPLMSGSGYTGYAVDKYTTDKAKEVEGSHGTDIYEEIIGVTSAYPTADSKMHDLWEEW